MSADVDIEIFGKKLYITLFCLLLFCKLASRGTLSDKNVLITGIERETLFEPRVMSEVN